MTSHEPQPAMLSVVNNEENLFAIPRSGAIAHHLFKDWIGL
jgi:hypothetical protein